MTRKALEVTSLIVGIVSVIVAVIQINQDANSDSVDKTSIKSADKTSIKSTAKTPIKSTTETPLLKLEPCSINGRCPNIKWVNIPAGHFDMGSNYGGSDERPRHRVKVNSFLMSETEVTVEQYTTCVERGVCSKPEMGGKCTWGQSDQYPINCISWQQARNFALWVGGDLPTEAQWEYAARGGYHHKYAGSDDPDKVAWYTKNTNDSGVRPVKSKDANQYGLYDLSGNLWEWTLDEWQTTYREASVQAERSVNCRRKCVIRGGSWSHGVERLRVEDRDKRSPNYIRSYIGFRVRKSISK